MSSLDAANQDFVSAKSHPERLINHYFEGLSLEDLSASVHELNKTGRLVTDIEPNPELVQSLHRVKQALDAVQDFSGVLKERLVKREPHSTEGSIKQEASTYPHSVTTISRPLDTEATEADTGEEDEFCFRGKGLLQAVADFSAQVLNEPQVFLQHYRNFAIEMLRIVQGKSAVSPEPRDHRFRDSVWQDNIFYRVLLQTYLAWAQEVRQLINDLPFEHEADRQRSVFLSNQLIAALSPSNSPLNPAAIKRAFQTGGLSVVAGFQNLLHDLATNEGLPRQINKGAYQVGRELAVSEGAVVFRSPVLELLQYQSVTKTVFKHPVIIVPPQINKFYIFDLSPKNSIVQHLLQNGHQVFMVSWKNPNAANAEWNLETYIKNLEAAIEAMADICRTRELGLISGCAGGMTATALQTYLHQCQRQGENKPRVRSHSVLVTALSAKQHPTLNLFLNKQSVAFVLDRAQKNGVMEGRELSHIFAWLRPVDLVWNFWVNNCLLGKEPPSMDVLFWDNDSTRLPAGLHRDFVDIVVNDRFSKPDKITIGDQQLNLQNIDSDFYFVGGEDDYLMPWKNCFRNIDLFPNASCQFVLSNSGHIQSILRPPGIAKTYYYTNTNQKINDPNQWLEHAEKHEGSWWNHWTDWLSTRSGTSTSAPTHLGSDHYPPLCASPGTYVLES